MARIVKPNLSNVEKTGSGLKIKEYSYKGKNTDIGAKNDLFNFNDKLASQLEKASDHDYKKSPIEAKLSDILKEGKLKSFLEQFKIFDDVTDEGTASGNNQTSTGQSNTGDPKKEDKPKDNKDDKKDNLSKPYGNLDMNNYPDGQYDQAACKARSVLVAKYLVQNGGFTKEQAAAMVGVFWDENGCYPGEVMKAEYKANKNSYGAGIGSWTSQSYKNQCLKDAGLPANTPIESLSMQQQCDMIIAMSQKSNKKYYDALKRCDNIEDASATAVCITGGVGFSNNWSTHPTAAEAKKLSEWYGSRNDKKYGYSEYHHNLDKRRLAYAKAVLAEL